MVNDIDLFKKTESLMKEDIFNSIAEIQQSRSNFQIENFVLGQHDTDEMKFYQCVIEIQQLYYNIKTVSLQLKKMELEIENLKSKNDPILDIEAQIKEIGLEQTKLVAVGAIRELKVFLDIYNNFEIKYTREDIEKNQLDYWNKRLSRQSVLESIGGSQSQAAHLDSLRQIGAFNIDEIKELVKNNNLVKEISEV